MSPPRKITDTEAVERIHALLDRRIWECGTLDAIAQAITDTGREIREPLGDSHED